MAATKSIGFIWMIFHEATGIRTSQPWLQTESKVIFDVTKLPITITIDVRDNRNRWLNVLPKEHADKSLVSILQFVIVGERVSCP